MPIDGLAKNAKMTVKKMTEKKPVKSLHITYVVKYTSVLMRSEWQTKYSGVNIMAYTHGNQHSENCFGCNNKVHFHASLFVKCQDEEHTAH